MIKSGLLLLNPFKRQFSKELSSFIVFEVDIIESY